jgi:hypothetical protein
MALLNTTTYQGAYLQETGREGVFRWNGSNMSAFVTLDPAQGVYVAKSTDATGASGAWVRDLPSFSVTCMWFGAVGDGNVTNMVADTYACQYAINFSAATSIPIIEREKRTYMIDGYKGANGSWTVGVQEAGGLWLKDKATITGAGRGVTTFKNGADNWRCVFNIQEGDNRLALRNLTIDGDVDNHHPMVLGSQTPDDPGGTTTSTTGAIRGEGIITWNNGTLNWIELIDLEIKNTGHYGIGLQASIVNGGIINGMVFENIGGDCIDGKYVELIADPTLGNHKKLMIWTNIISRDGCGHNYPGKYSADGHDVQTVLDVPRGVAVSNVQIYNLDTYDAGQQGNDGVRFRAQVDAITVTANRLGSEGSIGQNIKIFSSKLASEGSSTVKRVRGIVINSDHVSVSNFFVDSAFTGLDVSSSSDDVPIGVNVSNGVIQNCTGAGTDAKGVNVPASTRDCNFSNITVDGNEIGILLSGSASAAERTKFSNISILNNLVGISANALNLSRTQWSNISFHGNTVDCDSAFAQQIGTSSVAGWSCLHGEDVVVMKDRQAFFDCAAIASDSGWTGDDAWVGGQRFFAADASSGISAELARVGLKATGSTGADFLYEIQTATNAGGARIPVARFRDDYAQFLVPVLVPSYITTALPSSNPAGQRAMVTNALGPAFGAQVVGGGAVKTPVYSDGSGGAAPAGWIVG